MGGIGILPNIFLSQLIWIWWLSPFLPPIGFDPANALTTLLYSGEQTDSTGLQYLRARYYDATSGRFSRLDPFAGNIYDPQSLHKYLYANADPIMCIDPSGQWSLGSVSLGITIGMGLTGAITGYYSDSAGHWLEGFIPGWGSGRGLGNAIRDGDAVGIGLNGFFLALDLFTMGGYSLVAGSAKTAPKLAANIGKEQIEGLYKTLVKTAGSTEFRKRIMKAGFNADQIPVLLRRLKGYFDKGRLGYTAKMGMSWTDDQLLAFSRSAAKSFNKMSHELTHVLDDIAENGLLQANRLRTLNWWQVSKAEYKAFFVQTGSVFGLSHIMGGGGSLLSISAHLFGAEGTVLGLRELIYASSLLTSERD